MKQLILLISMSMVFGMISTPNIRPFDDTKMSKQQIWDIIVGKFHEVRSDERGEHLHAGVDYALNKYTEILATGGGTVIFAEWAEGYGNCIVIDHDDGYSTLYAHVQRFNALQDQIVKRKQVIGYVGATGQADGNHIHYELRHNGTPIFPGKFLIKK